jgi:type III restriction enzyme
MAMQLQFEHNLDYQLAAIDAVCDLFAGQEICRTEFTVTAPRSLYIAPTVETQTDLPGLSSSATSSVPAGAGPSRV